MLFPDHAFPQCDKSDEWMRIICIIMGKLLIEFILWKISVLNTGNTNGSTGGLYYSSRNGQFVIKSNLSFLHLESEFDNGKSSKSLNDEDLLKEKNKTF
ncbi:hypothetical protein T10_10885 [Trichinella papuae]|uniref:Uncharacterized protein n=1 Tax=Trichinella papuae TaxID=268474 RepID=A0A0V1N4Z8_9BILA|nr:hypothetical protein T10_10885 [Trichinella papuae]